MDFDKDKAKSVRMTEEGIQKAEALFLKHFGSKPHTRGHGTN